MMRLFVDVGNSCCKWAFSSQQGLSAQQSMDYTADTLLMRLDTHWQNWAQVPTSVWVSNVAGNEIRTLLQQWMAQHWQCSVVFAHTETRACGVVNGYEQPQQLGVDRWLALLGAHQLNPEGRCLVVDCGTAVTLDVLNQHGEHQGGWILPGLQMMRSGLQKNAHALQHLAVEGKDETVQTLARPPGFLPAKNTQDGIFFGTLYAVISLVTQVWNTVSMNGKWPLSIFLTGGAALEVYPHLPMLCRHEPELVLKGLAYWAGERA